MKTFFFLILLLLSSIAYSQGNLQFNRVVNDAGYIVVTNNACTDGFSATFTVPTGKVWKIESFVTLTSRNYIMLNGKQISPSNNAPFWLKAGDAFYFYTAGVCNQSGNSLNWFFSAIEFNIVP